MKAYLVEKFGSWKNLKLKEIDDPKLQRGYAKIKTHFIGLNFADLMQREGVYPRTPKKPFIPGLEGSGVVEDIGEGLDKNFIGKRVLAFPIFGSHSEYVFTEKFIEIPKEMGLDEASALGVQGLTSIYALKKLGRPEEGESLLITASAGGVGSLLIQLGKYLKLKVYGLCGSKEKVEFSYKIGADFVLNYNEKNWYDKIKNKNFDIIIDSVGGLLMKKLYPLLNQGGRYIIYGFSSAVSKKFNFLKAIYQLTRMPIFHPFKLISANKTISGFNLSLIDNVENLKKEIQEAFFLWEKGVLKPHILKIYSFEDLPLAHKQMQERNSIGKIIIRSSS